MTPFDEAMTKYKGTWDGDFAIIKDRGYVFKVAKKTPAGIELLFDARRFITTEPAPLKAAKAPRAPKPPKVAKPDDVPAESDDAPDAPADAFIDPAAEEGE